MNIYKERLSKIFRDCDDYIIKSRKLINLVLKYRLVNIG